MHPRHTRKTAHHHAGWPVLAALLLAALAGTAPRAIADPAASHRDAQQAVLARASQAIAQGDFDAARRLLDDAAAMGNDEELAAARAQLRAAVDSALARETAARVAAAAALAAHAGAGGEAAEGERILHPHPVKPLETELPASLRQHSQNGYVTVEFMLDGNGRASRMHVVEAHPAGVYDDVALDAVRRGQFETEGLGGSRQPHRAQLRLAFRN